MDGCGLYLKLDSIKAIDANVAPRATASPWSLTPQRITFYSLCVTTVGLPLYVVRWHYGPLPTTLLETLVAVTVIAYLFMCWSERRNPLTRTWLDIPITLLLFAGAVSVVDAPSRTAALGIYRAYFLEAIAMYFVALGVLRTRRDVTTFLLIAGAGACAYAVGQIASFLYAVAHHHLDLSAAPSFLNTSANDDAMYLEAPFAFALAFTLFGTRGKERVIAAGMLLVIGVGLLLSFSRASYLALAVLAVVLVLSEQAPRRRLWAVGGVAVLALIVLEIPFVNQRFGSLADSVLNREGLYKEALQMLAQQPILGAGLSGFPVRVAPFRPVGAVIHIYPHDVWLTTWSELGLLGVLTFAFIVFALLWRSARSLPAAEEIRRPILWGVIGALVLLAMHGFFDSPYWKNDLSAEFWLAAALAVWAMRTPGPTSPAGPVRRAPAPPTRT